MSDFAYVDEHYLPLVASARAAVEADPQLQRLFSPSHAQAELDELDAPELLGFLIEFCAIGVCALRGVEASLRRASVRCSEAGYASLGADFQRAAKDAVSRRLRLIDDFVQLAEMWRERYGPALDLGALVRRPLPEAALRQTAARSSCADDALPLALLAVEIELGELAIWFGPQLMRACERKLGAEVLGCLTYQQARTEHAALRADDLLERLDDILRVLPELGPSCAEAGIEALQAQQMLFASCIEGGRALVRGHASVADDARV